MYTNRRAHFEFELLERFECGVSLTGSEIKSIRTGGVDFRDAFARFHGNDLFVEGLYVPPYDKASYNNHEPRRDRKLLLHRHELTRIKQDVSRKGLTLVPTKLYMVGGRAKIELAIARGKKLHDKRAAEADRQAKRDMAGYR